MERLPIKYFDTHAHGDIMSVYTNDIDTMRQMISQSHAAAHFQRRDDCEHRDLSMIILNVPLLIITLVMVATAMMLSVKPHRRAPGASSSPSSRIWAGSTAISRR